MSIHSLRLWMVAATFLLTPVHALTQTAANTAGVRTETLHTIEDHQAALRNLKEKIAKLPDLPAPSPSESSEVRDKRDKREKLNALVREIEQRLEVERNPSAQSPIQKSYFAYYSRLQKRVELEAVTSAHSLAIRPLQGRTIVVITLDADGRLKNVTTEDATSKEFAAFAAAVFKQLAPFEPFDIEMRNATDLLVIKSAFKYTRE